MSVQHLRNYIAENLMIWGSSVHGIAHWDRVWSYGQAIGWSEDADMKVVEYFAYLHDCKRYDDGLDPGHGGRAGIFAKNNRELFDLSDSQFKQLVRAVSGHTDAMPGCKAGDDPTLAVCWDSDRLDIDRVGITVDPRYLFTDMARELAYMKHESEEC